MRHLEKIKGNNLTIKLLLVLGVTTKHIWRSRIPHVTRVSVTILMLVTLGLDAKTLSQLSTSD